MRPKTWQKVGILPVEDVIEETKIQRAWSRKKRAKRGNPLLGTIQLGPHRIRVHKRQFRAAREFGLCCAGCKQKADQVEFFRIPGSADIQSQLVISSAGTRGTMTLDHILPRARGGTNECHNIWLMCSRCNGDKADLIPAVRIRDRKLHYLAA